MRVVQNKSPSTEKTASPEPKHAEPKDDTEENEGSGEETEEQNTEIERRAKFTISGAPARVSLSISLFSFM